ncbi:MAG: 50S ribosomal protein L10, partial [Christensenellaceae bacterium]
MKDYTLKKKEAVVDSIKEKLEASQSVVLIDYRGLTVAEVTELRNQMREAGVEYQVLKNTMI